MRNYIIDNSASLQHLIGGEMLDFSGRIVVKFQQLSTKQNALYEQKLNDLYRPCGCEMGAIFCILSIIGFTVSIWYSSQVFDRTLLKNGAILLFSAALLGKVTGILLDRYKFRKTLKTLLSEIN